MDLFLADALDLAPGQAPPEGLLDADGALDVAALLTSPRLVTNVAFHEAWHLAAGALACRADYWAFARKASPGGAAQALAEVIVERTSVRVLPNARELLERAGKAFAARLAELSQAAPDAGAEAQSALLRKLARRHTSSGDVSVLGSSDDLLEAYAELALRRTNVAEYEAWAGTLDDDRERTPSLESVFARHARAARALRIPERDPLLGTTAIVPPDELAALLEARATCNELLSMALARDGLLFRTDAGGALVVDSAGIAPPESEAAWKIRTLRGAPPAALLACLPAALYSRVTYSLAQREYSLAQREYSLAPREYSLAQREYSLAPREYSLPEPKRCARAELPARVVPATRSVTDALELISAGGSTPPECLVVTAEAPPDYSAAPGVRWVPAPEHWAKSCAWAAELCTTLLVREHATPPDAGWLAMAEFVARYASARRLDTRSFELAAPDAPDRLGDVVLIETRRNPLSVLALLLTLDNLRPGKWGVVAFASLESLAYLNKLLTAHVAPETRAGLRVALLDPASEEVKTELTPEAYSELLKSGAFWARLPGPRALIVQDDGMLVRPGVDAEGSPALAEDFVGARWADVPANAELITSLGGEHAPVGNGGLSLRSVGAMSALAAAHAGARDDLFLGRLLRVPEDVFFARALRASGRRPCPRAVADAFSVEQAPEALATAAGFHKPWPYHAPADVRAFYARALADAAARA